MNEYDQHSKVNVPDFMIVTKTTSNQCLHIGCETLIEQKKTLKQSTNMYVLKDILFEHYTDLGFNVPEQRKP